MRYLLVALLLGACSTFALAQGSSQTIDLDGADAVRIYAAFSSVEIVTGGRDAVEVLHGLILDGEDRPELRQLAVERDGNTLSIRELKPTAELLQDQDRTSRNQSQHYVHSNKDRPAMINGVIVESTLKVTVPAGIRVSVETKYGGIRAVNTPGLVSARATYGPVDVIYTAGSTIPALELYSNYGAVDLTVPSGQSIDLDLTTEYGDLLTDLDIDLDASASKERDFYQRIVGKLGRGGVKVSCEAPYGNVYLREGE